MAEGKMLEANSILSQVSDLVRSYGLHGTNTVRRSKRSWHFANRAPLPTWVDANPVRCTT